MFADIPRHILLSHHYILSVTKSLPMHLCLDNSTVPYVRCHELFISPRRTEVGRGILRVSILEMAVSFVEFRSWHFSGRCVSAVNGWAYHVTDCCRSGVPLRSSCGERSAETIMLSVVVICIMDVVSLVTFGIASRIRYSLLISALFSVNYFLTFHILLLIFWGE